MDRNLRAAEPQRDKRFPKRPEQILSWGEGHFYIRGISNTGIHFQFHSFSLMRYLKCRSFYRLNLFWICNICFNDIVIYCIIFNLCRFFGAVNDSLCFFPKLCPETNRFFEKKKSFFFSGGLDLSYSHQNTSIELLWKLSTLGERRHRNTPFLLCRHRSLGLLSKNKVASRYWMTFSHLFFFCEKIMV